MIPSVIFSPSTDAVVTMVEAVRQHGVALVRGALPAYSMQNLGDVVDEFFDQPMEAERRDWIELNGLSGPNLGDVLPSLFALLGASIAGDVAQVYLGGEPVVPLNHLLWRRRDRAITERMIASGVTHNFHQDHDLVPGIFPLNLWLPLSEVDAECEGLSFAFPHGREVYPLPLPIEQHLARQGGAVWTPDMAPGDLLIFHRYTIHGGFFEPRPNPRLSVEMRLGNARELGEYDGPVAPL